MVSLTSRQLNTILFLTQGVATLFCGLFIGVYLLGLRDLPETVVYHSEPTIRAILSTLGVLSLILMGVAMVLSFYNKKD